MEDKVASRVCNLVFNIMYASLKFCCISQRPLLSDLPQLMASNVLQRVPMDHLKESQYAKATYTFTWLTILIIYDWLCSLLYTTNLLQNGCLACIGPSYDENTKIGTFELLLELHNLFHICYKYGNIEENIGLFDTLLLLASNVDIVLTLQQKWWWTQRGI